MNSSRRPVRSPRRSAQRLRARAAAVRCVTIDPIVWSSETRVAQEINTAGEHSIDFDVLVRLARRGERIGDPCQNALN